jgi:hypothetical protein
VWQGLGTNKSNPLVSGELLQRDLAAQSRSHDLTPLLLNALLLSAPIAQNTLYGMIMNGREVLFLKTRPQRTTFSVQPFEHNLAR